MIDSAITKIIILAFNLCFKAAMIDGVFVLGLEPIKIKKDSDEQSRSDYMKIKVKLPRLNSFVYKHTVNAASLKIKNNVRKTSKQGQFSLRAFVKVGKSLVRIREVVFGRLDEGKYQVPSGLFWT